MLSTRSTVSVSHVVGDEIKINSNLREIDSIIAISFEHAYDIEIYIFHVGF